MWRVFFFSAKELVKSLLNGILWVMWLGSGPSSVVTSVSWSCSDASCNFGPHWPCKRWQTVKSGHSPGFCQYIIKKADWDRLLSSRATEWATMLQGRATSLTPNAENVTANVTVAFKKKKKRLIDRITNWPLWSLNKKHLLSCRWMPAAGRLSQLFIKRVTSADFILRLSSGEFIWKWTSKEDQKENEATGLIWLQNAHISEHKWHIKAASPITFTLQIILMALLLWGVCFNG